MKDIEQTIRTYLQERGWDHLRPGDLAKSIAIEAGELLENFQWENPTLEEIKANPEKLKEVEKELADVLIYCLDLSVSLNLDTARIIEEKLEKARKKYPADVFKNREAGKDPGTESLYWKIKKEYRKKSS